MRKTLWAAMGVLVGTGLFALIAVQGTSSRVGGGTQGAKALETRLRVACGAAAAEEPPLRVFAMMPEAEGGAWRWKVEATLRPGRSPSDAETGRALDRAVALCLASPAGGRAPGGVLVVLHVPGRGDWTRTWDAQGRPR